MDLEPDDSLTTSRSRSRGLPDELTPGSLVQVLMERMPLSGKGWLEPLPKKADAVEGDRIELENMLRTQLHSATLEIARVAYEFTAGPARVLAQHRLNTMRRVVNEALALRTVAQQELFVRTYFSLLTSGATRSKKSFTITRFALIWAARRCSAA